MQRGDNNNTDQHKRWHLLSNWRRFRAYCGGINYHQKMNYNHKMTLMMWYSETMTTMAHENTIMTLDRHQQYIFEDWMCSSSRIHCSAGDVAREPQPGRRVSSGSSGAFYCLHNYTQTPTFKQSSSFFVFRRQTTCRLGWWSILHRASCSYSQPCILWFICVLNLLTIA